MSAGEYVHFRNQNGQSRVTQASFVATGATGVSLITLNKSGSGQLTVQRITLAPTTFATGALSFTETDATGAVIAVLAQPAAASAVGDQQLPQIDFGPRGYRLTAGKNLFMVRSATGSAGNLLIEAYETMSSPQSISGSAV